MTTLFASRTPISANYPSSHDATGLAEQFVGASDKGASDGVDEAHPMTDSEREQAAYRAGVAMQAAYSQYQHSGNAAHLDRAHRHLGQMLALVKGRTE